MGCFVMTCKLKVTLVKHSYQDVDRNVAEHEPQCQNEIAQSARFKLWCPRCDSCWSLRLRSVLNLCGQPGLIKTKGSY